jgi:hypothetical protein
MERALWKEVDDGANLVFDLEDGSLNVDDWWQL